MSVVQPVNPSLVPYRLLASGGRLPVVGLGTFGSDKYTAQQIADAVYDAAQLGYRHFDCAAVYANEQPIGKSLAAIMAGGIPRSDLFVTSKLWNDCHGPEEVRPAFERSLNDLGLDYLDLYLIHWPFPNFHAPGCDVTSRSADAQPYRHDAYMAVWRTLESLVDEGLVRNIGTSNMTIPKLELLLKDARIRPVVNQMELHPHFQQSALLDYVKSNGIVPVGYSPLGSPSRPERDRTPEDTVDMEDPVILEIAHRTGLTPASVCLKWGIQRGEVVIPFSVKREQYGASLAAAVTEPLTDEDMRAIAAIDKGSRLIKGQVFLWKEGQTWEDLWDLDGQIAN